MASSPHPHRRSSMHQPPGMISDAIHLYERDQPCLQRCIERLHHILQKCEKVYRGAAEGSRNAGAAGTAGGTAVAEGLAGLLRVALAPFTSAAAAAVASVVAGAGAATLTGAGSKSEKIQFWEK